MVICILNLDNLTENIENMKYNLLDVFKMIMTSSKNYQLNF